LPPASVLDDRRRLVIVTVTLNAAIDRTLTVPNFQRGQRHRASSAVALAGGKGINVARALKSLRIPVVATGLAGGQTGARILEELSHEAILNDFVRIEGESRTSTAVVDPTGGTFTEINEWGPAVRPEELETLLEKLDYLTQTATLVVFAGSLPRDVEDDFYAEAIHILARKGIPAALDCDGEPLRLGIEAEPLLVSPNQREAEAVVGHEFHDDEDFALALDQIADRGAKNVLITTESGCFALLREDRVPRRYRAVVPRVEPVSKVGSGDSLLGAFIAARTQNRPLEEQLRAAVAAGAASTFEVGAGRFDPRHAVRLQPTVDVTELTAAESHA
jgi:1-phosphofructokinase/tagatose 6-phosphate kinase